MTHSGSIRAEGGSFKPHIKEHELSKEKKLSFAIVIILSLGGLAVAGIGLGGFGVQHWGWQAGDLTIMMAAGGGTILLSVGIMGFIFIKNHQNNTNILIKPEDIDTQDHTVYGPQVYQVFKGVQVVGEVGPIPKHLEVREEEKDPFSNKSFKKSFPYLYIPKQIAINGEVINLTINNLVRMTGIPFISCASSISESKELGDTPLESGWRRISVESFRDDNRDRARGEKKYRRPHALEAAIFMYIIHALTGEWIYDNRTRCIDHINLHELYVGKGTNDSGSTGVCMSVSTTTRSSMVHSAWVLS